MEKLGTFVAEGPSCMFYEMCFMKQGIKFTEVWHMWFFAGILIWYHPHTNTHKHT